MTGSLFIVTFHMRSGSTGTYELDMDRMTRSLIIADILDGQFEDINRVIECPEDVKREDVTEEIARLVNGRLCDEQKVPGYTLTGWLQGVLGVGAVAWPAEAAE